MTYEGNSNVVAGATVMERLAQNASMQTIARLAMIAVAALFVPFCGIGGWVAVRVIVTIDKLIENQTAQNDRLLSLQGKFDGKMQLLELQDLHLDSKLVEIDSRINKRIDQISEWNRNNVREIDNLKEKVYPLVPRK